MRSDCEYVFKTCTVCCGIGLLANMCLRRVRSVVLLFLIIGSVVFGTFGYFWYLLDYLGMSETLCVCVCLFWTFFR